MKDFVRFWLPALAHMALIFFLSHQSRLPGPPMPIPYFDKMMHGLFYGVLGFLVLRAWLKGSYACIDWKAVAFTLLVVALYGLSDEFHQSFVPNRTPDIADWLADMTGATLVCIFIFCFKQMRQPAPSPSGRGLG